MIALYTELKPITTPIYTSTPITHNHAHIYITTPIAHITTPTRLVQDAYAERHGTLQLDEQQDYAIHGVEESAHQTVIAFSRLADTCDDNDYAIDVSVTQ